MRIISGIWGRTKLVEFGKMSHLRPTTDRVKESLFNIIPMDLQGSRVLDLFAGTGSISFEALSRGASYAELVELNPRSIAIINENCEKLKIDALMSSQKNIQKKLKVKIVKGDVFKFLEKRDPLAPTFDFVFADPPFDSVPIQNVLTAVDESNVLASHSLFVMESPRRQSENLSAPKLELVDCRHFGDKDLLFFRKVQS
jgi:16S rRNA (guanine966-N2)-methyltransferase